MPILLLLLFLLSFGAVPALAAIEFLEEEEPAMPAAPATATIDTSGAIDLLEPSPQKSDTSSREASAISTSTATEATPLSATSFGDEKEFTANTADATHPEVAIDPEQLPSAKASSTTRSEERMVPLRSLLLWGLPVALLLFVVGYVAGQ